MKLAVSILARNEAAKIGSFIEALARQSVFDDPAIEPTLFVAANGCSDDTAAVAEQSARQVLTPRGIAFRIFDFSEPGKSRSWNRLMHREMGEGFDLICFVDADIVFIDDEVLAAGVRALAADPRLQVYTGYPIKHLAAKTAQSPLDRLSLATSQLTRYVGKINGSLYIGRADVLKAVWLPDETPGEDGFLNAMIDTNGFTRPTTPHAIMQSSVPTHYFEAHSPAQFINHERRMIVGTMINRWIFEYLWSQKLTEPAGALIARLNAERPKWVEELIAERVRGRRWVIPKELITRRLSNAPGGRAIARLVRLPLLLAATAMMIPPAVVANRALKQRGAASLW